MNAPAIVLIPGTLCDARVFDAVVARLPGRQVQVATLGEHERVEAAATAILAETTPRFVVAGFSLGGFVALEMLQREPTRIAGVVLIAGNAHPDAPANASKRRADVAASREQGMHAYVRAAASAWGIADRTDVIERVAAMACAAGPDAHARHAEMNIARPDLREVARGATVPIVVLAGDDDRLCPPERYAEAASGATGRLVRIAGAGHYLPLEAPAEVAAAIAALEDRP